MAFSVKPELRTREAAVPGHELQRELPAPRRGAAAQGGGLAAGTCKEISGGSPGEDGENMGKDVGKPGENIRKMWENVRKTT